MTSLKLEIIERRKPVPDERFPDVIVGCVVFDISEPWPSHAQPS
jgi:hypothetical protein